MLLLNIIHITSIHTTIQTKAVSLLKFSDNANCNTDIAFEMFRYFFCITENRLISSKEI